MTEDTSCYNDIIDLPRYVSKKYPPMKLENRAAQFAPFAAMVGHDEAIERTKKAYLDKFEYFT